MSSPVPSRSRDATATRDALLDAAQAIFARDGFSGARIDEIARASGYNKSLLFQYFTDKTGLYRAVIKRFRETSDAAFTTALAPYVATDSSAMTSAYVENVLRLSATWSFNHLLDEPDYLRLFCWEMAAGWVTFQTVETGNDSNQWGLEFIRSAQLQGLVRASLTAETIVSQIVMLPFITLASAGRFLQLQPQRRAPNTKQRNAQLREQVVQALIHLTLPDRL
jgi:TetR/AcrR family transcriptional regulator